MSLDIEMVLQEDSYHDEVTTLAGKAIVKILAAEYAVMYTAQAGHWNVRGRDFVSLHDLFKESYELSFEAIDEVAEQARILEVLLPDTLDRLLAAGPEALRSDSRPEDYVNSLKLGHERLKTYWDSLNSHIGDELPPDAGLADLAGRMSSMHAKMIWKLRSYNADSNYEKRD